MRTIVALCVLFVLAGCEQKPPAKTVVDPQVKALEKARAVEAQVQKAGEKRAEDAERQTMSGGY